MGPGHLSPLNLLIAFILAELVVKPVATLVHELAHATVALRIAPGPVIVLVGKPDNAVQILFKRLKISWSPIPLRRQWLGFRPAGYCKWSAVEATSRDRLLVSLAGPLATALLIPLFIWATVEYAGMSQWIPATWGICALDALISCLFNLDPRPANDAERAGANRIKRDGPQALAAYREWRAIGDPQGW